MKSSTFGRLLRNLPALVVCFPALMFVAATGWGQTTNTILTTQSGGGALPSGWTSANNVTANAIDRTSYWLVEPGSTKDFITSTNYNLAGYTSLTVNVNVATFGSGSPNLPLLVEVSTNNGGTYFTNRTSATPTSTTYVTGGPITFSNVSLSSNTVIRFSANGSSGASVRIQQLGITGVVPSPTIIGAATATAFTSTYGTASTAQTFSVSGSDLTANLVATAPTGFEVSSDGATYGNTATFTQSGGSASGSLRIRLKADAAVGGSYNARNIVLSSTGATSVNITTASSGNSVSAKALTITGLAAENKNWDGSTTVNVTGTPAYSGLVNGETFNVTDSVTWAFADANVGTGKTLTRTGSFTAPSANYTVTQPILTANISAILATAPAIDSITPGNGQLSVTFSAPSSNGGAAVTNYEYSLNGGSAWTARSPANTANPLIISGLINGTTYDVQLRAVNAAGSGAASGTTQGTPVAPSVPTITLSKASLTAKTTTYGTPSASETFTVAGATLTSGDLTVSAPTGFEVSADGTTYSSSVNLPISGGNVIETTIYARLAATAAVSGSYNSQNITVSGGGATTQNVVTASSGNVVSAKALTITGLSASGKVYDGTTNVSVTGSPAYSGLANGETFSVTGSVTWAFPNSSVGNAKILTRTGDYGAPSSNYNVTQPTLSADITQATAPNLTAATNATVDNPFEVTFNETSSLWRSSITSITVGGTTLSSSAYSTATSGKITFNPGLSALLQSSGSKSIVVAATGHNNATVTQSIGAGTPMQLSVATQPTAPATNGAVLATQPVVRLLDLYNNVTTNSDTVTAAATQTNWALGGTSSIAAVNGTATFSGLTATSAAAVTNATVTFASGSLSAVSSSFNLSAPPAPNDGSSNAILLTVNAAATAGSFTGSTPTFSTSSTNNDVWYKFVATSTSHTLTATASTSSADPDIRVYEGTGASFNTPPTAYSTPTPLVIGQLSGDPEETIIATNFVVGRTYFVLLQDFGNVGGSFGIQVRTASPSIATWNPTWSGTAASPLNATSADSNLSSGSISRTGLTGSSNGNRYSATGWHTNSNYLAVTLTAAVGNRMNLNDAVLYGNWSSSGTGPSWYIVRSSLDNYATDIGYFDADGSNAGRLGAFRLPSTGYGQLSSITFRIYGSSTPLSSGSATASGGTGGFSALRVTGSLIQLPVVTPATVTGTVGTSLSYSISATGTPTSYAISSGTLPSGLSLDTTTGVISGTPSAAGDGAVVALTASNSAGTSAAANLTFNIAKATPSITSAPTASAIIYGQTLANSVLSGGTASVAGSFAFTAPSTPPNAGTANQNITFTPTDTANYNTATTNVSVTVNKATPSITMPPSASSLVQGQTLASSILTGGTASVAGTFAWTDSSIVPLVGAPNCGVTFTPTDSANYNTASTSVNVTVLSNSAYQTGYSNWTNSNSLTGVKALPDADPDGDGFFNSTEYAFGTRPNVADGSLVTTVATNGVFRTSWNGPASGVTYGVQSSTDLSTMAFSNDPTVNIQTNAGVMSFTNQTTGNKFFRVRATSN